MKNVIHLNILQYFILIFSLHAINSQNLLVITFMEPTYTNFIHEIMILIYIYIYMYIYNTSWLVHKEELYGLGNSLHSACHIISRRYSYWQQNFLKAMRFFPFWKCHSDMCNFFKLKCKIIGNLYLLSEVTLHPLTRTRAPARSPAILLSLMGRM